MYHRTATDYARGSMRTASILLNEEFVQNNRYPPGKPYWGPLTPQLIKDLRGDPNEIIDPYNRAGDPDHWRVGPRASADRGSSIRVKGLDFWYFTNGESFWALVSRGPDGDLDVTTPALAQAKGVIPMRLNDLPFESQMYDVSNGTVSNGDIVTFNH